MALVKCAECEREISEKATSCPHCGAPPEVFLEQMHWSIQAATHCDGNILFYDEPSRAFALGGAALSLRDVWDLSAAKKLTWIREDLREVMRDSVMEGVPMGAEVPPSRPNRFLEMVERAATPKSAAMVCPHCQSRGTVRTKQVKQEKGVSGGKATAAVLTGGLSLLATGLSRKEDVAEARCSKCGNTWYF